MRARTAHPVARREAGQAHQHARHGAPARLAHALHVHPLGRLGGARAGAVAHAQAVGREAVAAGLPARSRVRRRPGRRKNSSACKLGLGGRASNAPRTLELISAPRRAISSWHAHIRPRRCVTQFNRAKRRHYPKQSTHQTRPLSALRSCADPARRTCLRRNRREGPPHESCRPCPACCSAQTLPRAWAARRAVERPVVDGHVADVVRRPAAAGRGGGVLPRARVARAPRRALLAGQQQALQVPAGRLRAARRRRVVQRLALQGARAAAVSARASTRAPPARPRHQGSGNIQAYLNSRVLPPNAHMLQACKVGDETCRTAARPAMLQQPAPAPRRLLGSPAARMQQARRVTGNAPRQPVPRPPCATARAYTGAQQRPPVRAGQQDAA
jgi:hypothetical protein